MANSHLRAESAGARSSSNDMTSRSRRQIISGAALFGAGAVILSAAPVMAREAPAQVSDNEYRGAWDTALAAYLAAKEHYTSLNNRDDRLRRFAPRINDLDVSPFNNMGTHEFAHLADLDLLETYATLSDNRAALKSIAHCRTWRARYERFNRRTGYDAFVDHCEVACEEMCAAMDTLMALPAPDQKALLFKLEEIVASEEDTGSTPAWRWSYVEQTVADMRRLLAGEA